MPRIRLRRTSSAEGLLGACLGTLEVRLLESLWSRAGESAVRGVAADLPGTAYTTVMTTLDRLYKKGLLERRKEGRAFLYRPRYDRAEVEAMLARDAIDDLLREGGRSDPAALLVGFVEAVGERDAKMLDELERLVRRFKNGGSA
jgi:predicted transcriptional regulator